MALTTVKTTALSGTITNAQLAGSIDLTAKVTGTLPIANGGTNSTSTTYCDLTANATGTLPVGNGGSGRTAVTGNVLQVIQYTMGSFVTTSSTSYVDFSSMLVTITPSATSSKILLIHAAPSTVYCDNDTNMGNVALFRDTTNITALGHNSSFASYQKTDFMEGAGITYLDSPSSTSAIEYKVKCKVDNASLQFIYGSYFTDGSQPRQSSLIAMEIAG